MDVAANPADFMALASAVLLLLLNANTALDIGDVEPEEELDLYFDNIRHTDAVAVFDTNMIMQAALHNIRLCNVFSLFDANLGFWVKPRSTVWFSRFLLQQYDEDRWLKIFRMSKPALFSLAKLLEPIVKKHDTKYRLSIPAVVRVACTLFKLTHGASLLICSEFFDVGRSTVSLMLREVVQAINVALRSEISWPAGNRLLETEANFKSLCGLPGVIGAIDGTHVAISKPKFGPVDYYYFKSGGYSLHCQAVVDSNKRFTDLFIGMPGAINDARVLRRSSLYYKAMHNTLWDPTLRFDGFSPFLIGDSGYPLMPCLIVPNRRLGNLPIAEALFNKKLSRGRGVVENAFGIVKQTFRELLGKSELHVSILPDVILACALFHNVLLGQSHEDVDRLLQVLQVEGLDGQVVQDKSDLPEDVEPLRDDVTMATAINKRRDLGVYLALQWNIGP